MRAPAAPGGGALGASLGLVATAILWGVLVPATVLLLPMLGSFALPAARYALAAPVLVLLCVLVERRWPFHRAAPWGAIGKLGFVMAVFAILYVEGIRLSDPVAAALILSCGPVVAALLAWLLYRRPLSRVFWGAAALSVAGAFIVSAGAAPDARPGAIPLLGELVLVLSSVTWQLYSFRLQEWLGPRGYGPLTATALTATVSAALLVLAALAAVPLGAGPTTWALSGAEWALLAGVAVGSTAMAVTFWNLGVRRVGVPVAALYANLAPLVAVASLAALGAPVTWVQLAGGALILAGVLAVQRDMLRGAR